MVKIAIIGAGNVGAALGTGWAKAGHEVAYAVRNPQKPEVLAAVARGGDRASAANIADAVAGAAVVVLATPWNVAQAAIQSAGNLDSKILLDCTNPLAPDLSGLAVGLTTSAGEMVAAWAPSARVVKIFNTTGYNNMEDPDYNGQAATMFYCGDDADAKETAGKLAADLGFDPVDAGPLKLARTLEPLAMLWISMAFGGYGRDIAFKLLLR
jgi:hypothetical protein